MTEPNKIEKYPLVSFVVVTYQGAKWIDKMLDSLVNQDYPNIEIIIRDDGSKDRTAKICQSYANNHPNIDFAINDKNLGANANFWHALSIAKGKYFLYASQDDTWEPECISILVAALEGAEDAVAAQGISRLQNDKGVQIKLVEYTGAANPNRLSPYALARCVMTLTDPSRKPLAYHMFIHGLLRRAIFIDMMNAHDKTKNGYFFQETELLGHLALAGRFIYVEHVLYNRTIQSNTRAERYNNDKIMKSTGQIGPNIKSSWMALCGMLRSPIIPTKRKLLAPPICFHHCRVKMVRCLIHPKMEWARQHMPSWLVAPLQRIHQFLKKLPIGLDA